MSPVAPIVTVPDSLNVTTPLAVVVMVLLTARFVPASCTPVTVFVFTVPFSVVVPEPAVCDRLAAVTDDVAVTFVALTIEIAPRRVAPTAPLKVTLPVPAVRVRSSVPAVVPVSVL